MALPLIGLEVDMSGANHLMEEGVVTKAMRNFNLRDETK